MRRLGASECRAEGEDDEERGSDSPPLPAPKPEAVQV